MEQWWNADLRSKDAEKWDKKPLQCHLANYQSHTK
jgi:hypothetical protein